MPSRIWRAIKLERDTRLVAAAFPFVERLPVFGSHITQRRAPLLSAECRLRSHVLTPGLSVLSNMNARSPSREGCQITQQDSGSCS